MGRKKLTFFPTCGSSPSRTLSFRTTAGDITGDLDGMQVVGSAGEIESSVESLIRGLSSDRFFFKPGKTSSILDEVKVNKNENELKESVMLPLKESVLTMEMDSTDPFVDFRKSMQEMVEADESLKEWDNFQELLSVYLAVNHKINHGYIIEAFVDLLLLNHSPSSSSSTSCSSSSSSSTSTSSSCNIGQELSLLVESSSISSSSSCSNNKKIMKSPESTLSFTSSASSSGSGICSSSTSHCLSSCSLEEEEDGDEIDDISPHKAVVSDNAQFS